MQLLPQELDKNGYLLLDQLEHNNIIPFIQTYLKKRTLFSVLYYSVTILCALIIALLMWYSNHYYSFKLGDMMQQLSYGIGLSFTLIPLHEYVHALAYKYVGASTTSYDANLKKFYFMAMADQFVANKKEFRIVALAPFIFISLCCIVGLFFVPQIWAFTLWGILFAHSSFCSGDFGLLSYFESHQDKEVITYDDKANKISYFYFKTKS